MIPFKTEKPSPRVTSSSDPLLLVEVSVSRLSPGVTCNKTIFLDKNGIVADEVQILDHAVPSDSRARFKLKFFTASIVTIISISSVCIWIPAQMQINHHFIEIDRWLASFYAFANFININITVGTVYRWDKFEKSVYLLLDAILNVVFIRTVKKRLIDYGLTKYDKVVLFNQRIIILSIGMDIFLLCMSILTKNPLVYFQFHPITYVVKLQIEITMSNLIVRTALATGIDVYQELDDNLKNLSDHLPNESFKLTMVHVQTQICTRHSEEDESVEIRVTGFRNNHLDSQASTSKDGAVAIGVKCHSTLQV
ncbi:hypothetical protein K435DRAFT_809198 [Dendrothele bispora CBS 962.96]|uniref:Uncharacterized protein n=1 Tax=Dendrothele bispora (strain CBS 962.96) TaxID=1314807 RepID=A0A4S8KZD9_DENBC|nr:hypothetical protein K435DRAFT_809198 [Dendrothele bispora CBS 962.96]